MRKLRLFVSRRIAGVRGRAGTRRRHCGFFAQRRPATLLPQVRQGPQTADVITKSICGVSLWERRAAHRCWLW